MYLSLFQLYCKLPYVFKCLINFSIVGAAAAQFEFYIFSGTNNFGRHFQQLKTHCVNQVFAHVFWRSQLKMLYTSAWSCRWFALTTFALWVLQQTVQDSVTEYIYEAFQNDMDEQGRLVYDSNIHIMNEFTVWFSKKVGFDWCEIDVEYIRGYVVYFREIRYLEV